MWGRIGMGCGEDRMGEDHLLECFQGGDGDKVLGGILIQHPSAWGSSSFCLGMGVHDGVWSSTIYSIGEDGVDALDGREETVR